MGPWAVAPLISVTNSNRNRSFLQIVVVSVENSIQYNLNGVPRNGKGKRVLGWIFFFETLYSRTTVFLISRWMNFVTGINVYL